MKVGEKSSEYTLGSSVGAIPSRLRSLLIDAIALALPPFPSLNCIFYFVIVSVLLE
jgi:hypothetical protein